MSVTVRHNIIDLPYSLHDMSVTGLEIAGDKLILQFAAGFVKIGQPCTQVQGWLEFSNVDWDFCCAYILDFCGNEGTFTGEKLSLADFAAQFINQSFEIIDETYGYNKSRLAGYLIVQSAWKECVLEIYHLGDMSYIDEGSF